MNKIKDISIDDKSVNIETNDGYISNIPIKDEYSLDLFSKAYADTKYALKNINYYNKCADISLFPIWISLGLLLAGYLTKFPLMDMLLMGCGSMSGLSLLALGAFKTVTRKLRDNVCNNQYWNELYDYSINGNKKNTKSNAKVRSINNKSNEYSMKRDKIIQDIPIKKEKSTYHFSGDQIIQDENLRHKKRW